MFNNPGAYGAFNVAAHYCGFRKVPSWVGEWQHGWFPSYKNIGADFIIGTDGLSESRKSHPQYVWRKDQETYLNKNGYNNVFAIGAPWIYLDPKTDSKRLKDSLLVFPPHAMSENGRIFTNDNYANYIKEISARFRLTTICVHPSDIKNNNWVEQFKRKNFNIITGADITSPTAMHYMRNLFQSYEYVTMSNFGSQLLYASYYGAKTSICGPGTRMAENDLMRLAYYRNNPKNLLLKEEADRLDKLNLAKFSVDPWCAVEHQDWAKAEIGLINKRSPNELKSIFNWSGYGRSKNFMKRVYYFAKRKLI